MNTYVVAAYGVTFLTVGAYVLYLWRESARERAELRSRDVSASPGGADPNDG